MALAGIARKLPQIAPFDTSASLPQDRFIPRKEGQKYSMSFVERVFVSPCFTKIDC
jgi:hypothetical protein